MPKDALATLSVSSASMINPGTMNASDRKSTRLNSSHLVISYAVFCLKKKKDASVQERAGRRARGAASPAKRGGAGGGRRRAAASGLRGSRRAHGGESASIQPRQSPLT